MTLLEPKVLDFRSKAEWRRWLRRNHHRPDAVWVFIYKKNSSIKGLGYRDALDEALCFGWIDGQLSSVDQNRIRQRWCQRRAKSIWSQINRRRALELISEGRMTEPGRAAIRAAKRCGAWQAAYTARVAPRTPPELNRALKSVPVALRNWQAFPPSARVMYVGWVKAAAKPETRLRRIEAVVRRSAANRKPGMGSLLS